ncbi:MAG TPA: hypothetical protein VHB97_15530 [Polyangia bacterium]|jgi:hypothetical protein|nr:hypothetical protein [Polyangia bacterium]
MRFFAAVLALGAIVSIAGLAVGCQGDGGAVSVRWRLVDLATGQAWDANDKSINARGVCCRADLDTKNHTCALSPWVVYGVYVQLGDPATGVPMDLGGAEPTAPCSARELTSKFNLPLGTWAISLAADASDMGTPVVTPAPQLRDITRGGVVNLDVVEIGVDPLPRTLPTVDAGVTQ